MSVDPSARRMVPIVALVHQHDADRLALLTVERARAIEDPEAEAFLAQWMATHGWNREMIVAGSLIRNGLDNQEASDER